jgi:hypothetical protein
VILAWKNHLENRKIWLFEIDSTGEMLWSKEYDHTSYYEGTSVLSIPDGGYVITGRKNIATVQQGFFMLVDTSGNFQFEKIYGGPKPTWLHKSDLQSDGNIIVVGTTRNSSPIIGDVDGWVIKLNQSGDTLWSRPYNPLGSPGDGNHQYLYSLTIDDNDNIIISGTTVVGEVSGTQDAWVLVLDSMGYCDTASCFPWLLTSTIDESIALYDEVSIVPNPLSTNGHLKIVYGDPQRLRDLTVDIYNLEGILSHSMRYTPESFIFDNETIIVPITTQGLSPGLYFIHVRSDTGSIGSTSVLISNSK